MKREGWSPQFINGHNRCISFFFATTKRYIAKAATKEFSAGDVRTDKIQEETERMEAFVPP